MNRWIAVTPMYNMNKVSVEKKTLHCFCQGMKDLLLKLSLGDRPASLFNIIVTLLLLNHKITLVPPEEFQAETLQHFRALLLTDEVTQPE